MENLRKHRDSKVETTEARRKYLVSKAKYHTIMFFFFSENLLAIEKGKTKMFINKPLYLGLSLLETKQIVIYELRYHYVKPKYRERAWIQKAL